MEWSETKDYLMVTPVGKLHSAWAAEWHDEVKQRALTATTPIFIINLAETDYVSSAFLRLLVIIHKESMKSGFQFCILSPRDAVRELLEMAGFDKVFQISESLHEVLCLYREAPERQTAVRNEGIGAEFTANGYYRLSGTAPRTGVLYRLPTELLRQDSQPTELGLSMSLLVGFLIARRRNDAAARGLLILGNCLLVWDTGGNWQLRRTDELTAVIEHHGLAADHELFLFDRLDDRLSFGCRWPDRGAPIQGVASDALELARERRSLSEGIVGFLLVGENRNSEVQTVERPISIVVGLLAPQTEAKNLRLPDATARRFESKGTYVNGIAVDLEAPEGFDIAAPDPFRTASALLQNAKTLRCQAWRPDATIGNSNAALTCFATISNA